MTASRARSDGHAKSPATRTSASAAEHTIRQYLDAGLIEELHIALVPVLLGRGERSNPRAANKSRQSRVFSRWAAAQSVPRAASAGLDMSAASPRNRRIESNNVSTDHDVRFQKAWGRAGLAAGFLGAHMSVRAARLTQALEKHAGLYRRPFDTDAR